uniref:Uncharacterized protein n=1 Tax=Rhizophora mucronata TaxID=61149 RepID=A0A2P2NWT0_RHIMU
MLENETSHRRSLPESTGDANLKFNIHNHRDYESMQLETTNLTLDLGTLI